MKNWTWQTWAGKVILLALSVVALVIDQLGVSIPLWVIILPAATQLAQWFIAWLPNTAWNIVVGRGLLMAVAIVELVLAYFGLAGEELLIIVIPMVGALAQWILSRTPAPEESAVA